MGEFETEMFICWQHCKSLMELLIERKELEQVSQQVENTNSVEKKHKKKTKKTKKKSR